MPPKISAADASYFLGFDGGGTKTECVLADAEGHVLARASGGPSNPLRTGYTRAWFALSETADMVLGRQRIHAGHIRGICAGLGGAGRAGVARRVTTFFQDGFPNASVRVTTDLEMALEQMRRRWDTSSAAIRHYDLRLVLSGIRKELESGTSALFAVMRSVLLQYRVRSERLQTALESLSPLAILERGYALVFDSRGQVLKDVRRINAGDEISARLAHGEFHATVTKKQG